MESNLVSIILCTYNGSLTIKRAIESVLNQTYQNWELVIVNDGSNDNVLEIISFFSDSRIFVYNNDKNLGIQKTRNRALSFCRGTYVAVLDDDDFWSDVQKIEKQVSFLDANSNYNLVGTAVRVFDEGQNFLYSIIPPEQDADIRKSFLRFNHFTHSSVVYRRKTAQQISGYSEALNVKDMEDYDFVLRMGTTGLMKNIQDFSTGYSLRTGSNSFKNKKILLKNNISSVVRHRKKYPGFYTAYLFSIGKYIFYMILFRFLPFGIKSFFLKLYKKI